MSEQLHKHRRLAENVAWLLVDRGTRLGLAFLTSLVVARQLGPGTYGKLSYAQASIGLLSFLSMLAIESIVIRMLVDEHDEQEEILGSAFLLRLIGGAATVLSSIVMMRILHAEHVLQVITPVIACVSLFQSSDVIDYWFRRKLLSRFGVVGRVAALAVGAVIRILACRSDHPLEAMALAILIESMLVAGALIFALRQAGFSVAHWRPTWRRSQAILRQALPMLLSAVAVAVYVRFGVIVLGKVADSYQVGLLGVANTVAETMHAVPVAIAASYGPILLGKRLAAPESFQRDFLRLLRFFTLGGIVLALSVSIAAPWLMPLAFGSAYAGSGPILAILVWSVLFVNISVASELWFVGNGLQRYFLPKTLIAACIYLLLTATLIPRFGARGAAVATLVTYGVSAFLSNSIFSATRPLFYWQTRALLLLDPSPAPRVGH